jgi:Uma2 family endonuclease
MSLPRTTRMSADEFLVWVADQEGGRYELAAGEVVAMAPKRVAHNRVKFQICRALKDAVRAAALPCEVFTDGMVVRIDDATVYEPDATLRCGRRLDDDAIEFSDPTVVVEVLSPSSRARDAGAKLEDYFRLPSVRHYLLLRTDSRSVIQHARDADGVITTTIHRDGSLAIDPPGLTIALADVFAEE